MTWFLWLLVGFVLGWFVNAMFNELRMQALTNHVLKSLVEMRDEWTPKA